MKDFVEQLNDMIAPITRAWVFPDIQTVTVDHGAIKEDEIIVTVVVKLIRVKSKKDPRTVGNLLERMKELKEM